MRPKESNWSRQQVPASDFKFPASHYLVRSFVNTPWGYEVSRFARAQLNASQREPGLAARSHRARLRFNASARSYLVAALALLATAARAGPPYQTDDPEPVALHRYEVNIAAQQTATSAGRAGTFPAVEINYGGAQDLQLHVGLPLALSRPASGATRHGLGDVEVGAKYRFVQETDTMPMLAVYPTYIAATGNEARGLGNGAAQLLLPLWAQKSSGPWTFDGGVGYLINRATGSRDSWFAGVLVQRRVSDRMTSGIEFFHRTRPSNDLPASTGFNVGATFDFDSHHHLLFSVGEGLRHRQQTNKVSSYLAFQITN